MSTTTTKEDELVNAAFSGNLKKVRQLLYEGININATDSLGCTPLYRASWKGHGAIVQLLLERGANVNVVNYLGSTTPLMKASYYGYDAIARSLLDAGAKVNLLDADGKSALDIAKERGNANIVKMLQEAKQQVDDFLQAARDGNLEKVQQSLDTGRRVDINTTDDGSSKTALMWASHNGHEHVVKLLLMRGALVDQTRRGQPRQQHPAPLEIEYIPSVCPQRPDSALPEAIAVRASLVQDVPLAAAFPLDVPPLTGRTSFSNSQLNTSILEQDSVSEATAESSAAGLSGSSSQGQLRVQTTSRDAQECTGSPSEPTREDLEKRLSSLKKKYDRLVQNAKVAQELGKDDSAIYQAIQHVQAEIEAIHEQIDSL